ncbi:hypothetical protein QTP86_020143, partial [Hemibagrus guttatus]
YTIMGKTADLTVVQRTIIDTLHKEGKPQTSIAKEAGCSQSAVSKHVNRKLSGRKKCGRKRCTTNRENRSLMRIVKQNPFKNLSELHKEWTEAGVKASRATRHRRVKEFGYSCRIPLVKPLLNHRQRQRRLTWAKEKKNWTVAQWSKVLFSDESKFCISFGNQGPRVWRKGGVAHSPSCLKSSVKFPQSVMIWGAVSSAGVGPLCFLKTKVTAPVYQEILEHFMLPSADQLFEDADFILSRVWVAGAPAHDRYPKHIAPDPYAPSCGWWAYGKVGLRRFFGLCPAESRRQRLGHQALACVPQPQAWLQGGAPNPFALGDPTRSTKPLTTWLLGSFGYSNPSTTIRWRFKEGGGGLFKKGDRRVCSYYRGITLLSLPGKVYSRVLERRVRPLVEPRIQEEQCGFRPSRGTLDQLYTLHRVLEGSWEFAQPVHMCFVDLEKAFDRVPRGILWEVLWEYGVHGPLLRAVRSLYNRSRSLVRIASCKSDLFPVHVGLRQGCPLSPVLFIVFMDRISRRSQGLEGVRFGDHRISSLIFADDVVLLASSGLDLQHALGRFAAECEVAGMRVSTSKSEAMVLDRKKVACTLQVGGEVLPQVEEFKYLGVLFTSEGRMDHEIDRRIGAAAAVMRSMYRSVVVKKELSRKAKLSIYQSIYAPTLIYGHELWVMTERVRSRIQAAEMSFLRRVAGRSLRDRVRSSVTREELGVEPLPLHIERGS